MLTNVNQVVTAASARLRSETGQAMAEYGLVLALIAVVCIAALTAIGLGISGSLGSITSQLGGGS